MPRPLRMCEDGVLYHVTCRGDNREPIFFDAQDYQQYVRFLQRYKTSFKFLMPCYCLMPNHVHLILRASSEASISKIMLCISTRYTQYFNRRYKRVGHVFEKRFYSKAIEDEPYLLIASRYVHLNPVAAQLCQRPEEYFWSSYRAYLDGARNPLVDRDVVLNLITGFAEAERAPQYCAFVNLPFGYPEESFTQASAWHRPVEK